ncbi:MAG: hypothetical protein JWP57_695 [Spirosoma sp.]|nr:hypothetical protein [Spirosoma sp.]
MKNQSISRADVLRTTWLLVRKSRLRFGEAPKRAWAAIRAKLALATTDERGIWLSFCKVDGTVRNVLATRNMTHIPDDQPPKKPTLSPSLTSTSGMGLGNAFGRIHS